MTTGEPPPSKETLAAAMKAFKRRLKLNRLDEESKIGRNPLSKGARSEVVALRPPEQYPQAVWEELVKRGRLKASGHGMYELVPQPDNQ